ncbi:acetylornithine transaminase [Kineosporia succinea]|uniref:Acetylornithine aminotransferase n=2 Tax=Kineosporia succinea TaxID=84632 RepID=A0ABT9P6L3_9ACTN|nr:acetylornithine transaminase [Kineosporia succinea]MDP9828340.1 acetylornithine aminotransferase [Kineosporia succinea]
MTTDLTAANQQLVDAGQGSAQWMERYQRSVLGVFGTPQRVLVRGEGAHVWDADGQRYLDLLGGIAVNALGHAHPFLVSAVTAQLATLGHVSNFFANPLQIALAERLLELAQAPEGSAAFFCNSGTEANEAAFKLTRRTGRTKVVAATGAFHGRSMGALAMTYKQAYREPFAPLPGDVVHVPWGDAEALAEAVDNDTAAVILEPIQGEAGVRPAPAGYLAAARRVTRAHDALLIFDEVQTGIGRTGAWFAHQLAELNGGDDITPDVMTLAKGLGGGIPVGALVTFGPKVTELLQPGQHGTTFGGNPVAAAAGLATLHVIERDGLLANVVAVGRRIQEGVQAHPLVDGVRGHGLLIAIQLREPVAAAAASNLLDAGFIVNAVAPDAIRLAPPLILTAAQADSFIAALPAALDSVPQENP